MKTFVCFGDSLTYGYGVTAGKVWHQLLKEKMNIRIINRGSNGDSLLGMQIRISRDVLESGAEICLFMAGSNDLMMGKSLDEVYNGIVRIKERILERGIKTIIISPPPAIPEMAKISWDSYPDYEDFNEKLKGLSERFNKKCPNEFINAFGKFMELSDLERKKLYLDGIHLNEEGNEFLGHIVQAGIL